MDEEEVFTGGGDEFSLGEVREDAGEFAFAIWGDAKEVGDLGFGEGFLGVGPEEVEDLVAHGRWGVWLWG